MTGNLTHVKKLRALCQEHKVTMVLDISQTFGLVPVTADMADVFCFTGHKGLFGPQGTGGVIVTDELRFKIVKTGGAGVNSFDTFQQSDMPDVFEVGTQNSHGIYGLQKGVQFVRKTGVKAIHEKEMFLAGLFYSGIKNLDGIRIYGDFSAGDRLPIVALTLEGLTASELSEQLWIKYRIATRAGSHCAPLLHKRFGTVETGIVRFSFSYFNTADEINMAIDALCNLNKHA